MISQALPPFSVFLFLVYKNIHCVKFQNSAPYKDIFLFSIRLFNICKKCQTGAFLKKFHARKKGNLHFKTDHPFPMMENQQSFSDALIIAPNKYQKVSFLFFQYLLYTSPRLSMFSIVMIFTTSSTRYNIL